MGTFSHHSGRPRSILAAAGLALTWPVPTLRVVPMEAPRGRVMSFGKLAKLAICYKRYVLTHPRLHEATHYKYGLYANKREPGLP